ncbi:MAG: GNAT family protein [Chloroflexota bacterium]|nr:GNAT family protein [Chloroflexota bacterium]MDE2684230.1 GNAT family protein [Chloroflexota bacterium]
MQIKFSEWQIRSLQLSDAPALAKYGNNRAIWRNLWDRHPYPYGIQDAEEWIQFAMGQEPETIFAIASQTEAIGCIGLLPQDDVARISAEVGYWLGEPFWNRGVATGALQALTEYAFGELGLIRLYATVMEWNPASARVLEKAGYQYEGLLRKSVIKDGKILDQWLYAIVRD